jgi:2-haloacid dehalogenase
MQNSSKPAFIFLDVYETLLDMSEVERKVNAVLDSKRGYIIWFNLFMEYCFVDTCIDQFNDFPSIARATMQMAGKLLSVQVDDDDINNVLDLLKHLPVHADVQDGLSMLNDQGFYIAALTNSPEKTVRERMERTGLISYFKKLLSAEHIKKYKPDQKVYQWAAAEINARPAEIIMISAHSWDLAGAANAGMQTAYLKRTEKMHYPLAPAPDFTGKNLTELADRLRVIKF